MKKQEAYTNSRMTNVGSLADTARQGYTLLEILLVLALIVVLLSGLAALVRVFSNNYYSNERRVGRAQLARSISQMLEDDLGSAVQDPIQAVADDANRQFIRHFGLRGDARSLQIDVVQPSLFAKTATVDENQRVQSGGDKSASSKQVPELKTIFYEFIPINANEEVEDKEEDPAAAALDGGEDLGSTLTGSLSSSSEDSALSGINGGTVADLNSFPDPARPLVQKYGLARRELDYETPEEEEVSDELDTYSFGVDTETGLADSRLSGSLTSAPDLDSSSLTSSDPTVNALLGNENESQVEYKEPLTAVQIAMDSDDGTTWAPEVLDCRFSYFDGTNWRDSWDSIQDKGLPIAIKVELKLAPLDDVDLYRGSKIFQMLPSAPDLETLAKLNASEGGNDEGDDVNISRLTGSLNKIAQGKGEPVDVFNSYRPLAAIRAAMEGVVLNRGGASADAEIAASSMLIEANESGPPELDDLADDEGVVSGLGGSISGSDNTSENDLSGGLSSVPGAAAGDAADGNMDPALALVAEMMANGAVFNEAGICIDYSNDGSYVTVEQIASELGLSEPDVYEVVVYLPTTPLSRATTVQRRVAATVRQGNVSTRRDPGAAGGRSGDRRAQGLNPYATGRARRSEPRERTERTRQERTAQDRQRADRQTAERGRADRRSVDRGSASERVMNDRIVAARQGAESRTINTRDRRERLGRNGGWIDDSQDSLNYGAARTQVGDEPGTGGFADMPADDLGPGGNSPIASPQQGGLAGGLVGGGGSEQVQIDPFAIIDQQQAESSLPFASADAGMDPIGGMTMPGLIETPFGQNTVASPTANASPKPQGQQQTWIRGKR